MVSIVAWMVSGHVPSTKTCETHHERACMFVTLCHLSMGPEANLFYMIPLALASSNSRCPCPGHMLEHWLEDLGGEC